MCEVDFGGERVVDLDPVYQHHGVIGFGAPNADLRNRTGRTLTIHGDAGHSAQCVGDEANLALLEFLAGDHADG